MSPSSQEALSLHGQPAPRAEHIGSQDLPGPSEKRQRGTEHRQACPGGRPDTAPARHRGTEAQRGTGRSACSSRSSAKPAGLVESWISGGVARAATAEGRRQRLPSRTPSVPNAPQAASALPHSQALRSVTGALRGRAGRAGQRKGEALHSASHQGRVPQAPLGQCQQPEPRPARLWVHTGHCLAAQTAGTRM